MKNKTLKVVAYIYMPLLFTVLGYGLLKIAFTPIIDFAEAVGSMVIAKEVPDFNPDLTSIFDPASAAKLAGQSAGNAEAGDASGVQPEEGAAGKPGTVSVGEVEFPANGSHFAQLACARIGLDAPVYWGDTNKILKNGAGQFMGSFLPGFGRPILISAHNTTYFKPLQKIEIGDVVTYQTNYGIYEYEITDVQVIHMNLLSADRNEMLSADEETLILYTCYPFYAIAGTKRERLVASGTRISGPDVE